MTDELGVYGEVLLQSGNGMSFLQVEKEISDVLAGSQTN
jgi:hypothetical protein